MCVVIVRAASILKESGGSNNNDVVIIAGDVAVMSSPMLSSADAVSVRVKGEVAVMVMLIAPLLNNVKPAGALRSEYAKPLIVCGALSIAPPPPEAESAIAALPFATTAFGFAKVKDSGGTCSTTDTVAENVSAPDTRTTSDVSKPAVKSL